MLEKLKKNLRFSTELEQEFQKEYFEKSDKLVRTGILIGLTLYALFGILDIWIMPSTLIKCIVIRYVIIVPIVVFTIFLTYLKFFKKHNQLLLSISSFIAGLGVIAMISISDRNDPGFKYYFVGLLLIIMWIHTFIRLRFLYSTITSLAITTAYNIVAIFGQGLLDNGIQSDDFVIFLNNNFFFTAANVIGMFASYHLEVLNRKEFELKVRTIKENEENKAKNKEILKQKEEISIKNKELHMKKEEINSQAEHLSQVNKELEQLSVIAKKTDNAIMIADTKGHIEWVNEGFVRLYGYNLDQLFLFKGNNLADISGNDQLRDVLKNGFKGSDAIIYETLTQTKFGDKLWIQTTLTPVINEKKEIVKLVAIDSNINKLKKAEEEIVKQKEEIIKKGYEVLRQKEIIEQSFNNMEILNQIGHTILSTFSAQLIVEHVYNSVNSMLDAAVFVLALHNEEKNTLDVIGAKENGEILPNFSWDLNDDCRLAVWCFKNQKEVLVNKYPEQALNYIPKIQPPVVGGVPESVIYHPLILNDKTVGVISVQSFNTNAYNEYHLNILKNLALYVSVALDNAKVYKQLLDQKEEIEKSHEQLQKLSVVASKTDNAVFISDPSGKIEWVNEGFTRIYGFNLDQLKIFVGNNLLNLSNSPVLKDVINNGFKDRDAIIYENQITTKFGEKIWVQTTLTPIYGDNKKVEKLIAIDSNINKRKLAEEEILKQKDELEAQRDFVMRQGDKIATQNVKIKQQRDLVVKQKKEITDSIQYAKRIQTAILPRKETLDAIFSDYFVLFKPKDIVSGDFYWVQEQNNMRFFAAVDCTGHGVPGAFMSMLGISYLNEIVLEKGITVPSEILARLRSIIISTLHQTGQVGESKDGMDIALCVIDTASNTLQYAGANNSMYLIREAAYNHADVSNRVFKIHEHSPDEKYYLAELKADKMPIGVHAKDKLPFTNHTIQLKENDSIYVFSDGYVDQFGGENHKKFLSKRFRDLLLSVQHLPMSEQKQLLYSHHEEWKGHLEQIDDVLVIGVKYS